MARLHRRRRVYGVPAAPPVKPWKHWTLEEVGQVRRLLADGYGYDEAARVLGRSRLSVQNKCRSMGINLISIRLMLSAKDIARVMGVGRYTVIEWVKRRWLRGTVSSHRACGFWRIP